MAEQQDKLIERCKSRETAGMERTRAWNSLWTESFRYFLSDQLRGRKKIQNWDWVVLNYIWPAIMQELAKLSRDFRIVATPMEEDDTDVADAFGGFLSWQWKTGLHRHGMKIEQLRAILDKKLYGYCVSKIFWDRKVTWNSEVFPPRWDGEVRHRLWRPTQFWASDAEFINDGDCGTVRWVELEYAKSLWPEHKSKLEENSKTYKEMLEGGGEHIAGQASGQGTYPAPGTQGTGGQDNESLFSASKALLDLVLSSEDNNTSGHEDRKYCKISETYLKDYTVRKQSKVVEADQQELLETGRIVPDANGGFVGTDGLPMTPDNWPRDQVEWSEPVFPNGRMVIWCEDTILNPKEEDQVYPHSIWPFVVIPHYLLPHMWQGSDAVTLYRHTQDHINVTVSYLVNNAKLFGNPRVAVEKDALAQEDSPGRSRRRYKMFAGAGAVIKLARGGLKKFSIIPPNAPSAGHVMLYQMFAQEYKNIQGLQDIAKGIKTSGSTTATEAQHLAISSNDRIKLQNVFEELWARQIVGLTAEMDQFYYDVGRLVRIIGEDKLVGAVQISQRAKAAKFDIDIELGEGLPYDDDRTTEKHKIAYELMGNPNPNPMLPLMLRQLKIPGWQKLLSKHETWQKWIAFEELIKSVQEGKVAPEEALQMLIRYAQSQLGGIGNGNNNGQA